MTPASSPVRFGSFELDLRSGELRKQGIKIRLADQPLQVLQLLLENPGQVVTREELQRRLWSSDTFVDFEHSLNAAVKRLREALSDTADNPKFIETLPRHGYRFIAAVEPPLTDPPAVVRVEGSKRNGFGWPKALMFAALIVSGAISYIVLRSLWQHVHPPAPEIRAIAVLPLVNLSEDPSQEYFSDGMTEALISELSRIRAIRVISRQSVMRYKGTEKPVPQIGKELHVDAIVEGSATRDGDKVRISVQLIRVNPEEHLWARSYERQMHDILSLQSEAARAIAIEIRAQLAPEEWARLSAVRSVNPLAYDSYLRGRYKLARWDPHMREAISDFEQSVALDPDYAPAYVGLADSYILMIYMDSMAPTEALTRAQAALTHALQLDGASADAYRAMGSAHARSLDWSGAQAAYSRALQLNPASAQIHSSYGWYLVWLGHFDEALREEQHALERDPMSLFALRTVGMIYFCRRQYGQAMDQWSRALALDPENILLNIDLGRAYMQVGMYPEAIALLEKSRALAGGETGGTATGGGWLGLAYATAGKTAQAQRILNDLLKRSRRSYVSPLNIAMIYMGLDKKDEAVRWLEKGYDVRDGDVVILKVLPIWDPLRSDPRFQELILRINYPQ